MHNPNDKPVSSTSAAIPPKEAHVAQPVLSPKAGDATAAGSPVNPVTATSKCSSDDARGAVDGAAHVGDAFVKWLVKGAHPAIDKLADAAGSTVDRIAGALSSPSAKASGLLGQARETKGAWISDVRDIVREHPIAAIAVALAAGAVYVRLTAGPSSDLHDGLDD